MVAVILDTTATQGPTLLLHSMVLPLVTYALLDTDVLKILLYLYPVLTAHSQMKLELLLVILALRGHSVLMGSILSHAVPVITALQELAMNCSLAPVVLSIHTTI